MYILRALSLLSCAICAAASYGNDDKAGALQQKYALLAARLGQNQFKQPVVLDSSEEGNLVTGEIFAVIDQPFAKVEEGLSQADHWCDVLSLHINTKYCRAVARGGQQILKANFGTKNPQRLQDAARIEFIFTSVAASGSYLDIELNAGKGALGSSDFHIEFEAVPLATGNTFMHFTYSYSINFATRFATKAYLATIGRNKTGFTVVGADSSGQPVFIGGVRGIMERNTMRYYLAITSYFATTAESEPDKQEQRLQSWFTAVEQYSLQLHELERSEYISMKHAESLRQQTAD